MTPEQKVVNDIRKFIYAQQRVDTWTIKPVDVPNNFPDHIGAWHGRPIAYEVKAPGEEPREGQLAWLARLRESGYCAFWCHSVGMFIDGVGAVHPIDDIRAGREPRVKGWPTHG